MKKEIVYLLTSFTMANLAMPFLDVHRIALVILVLPIIAFIHEIVHFIAIKLLHVEHKFVSEGIMIGFRIRADKKSKVLTIALAPQSVTLALLITYLLLNEILCLYLALFHILISIEDIMKIFKYGLSGVKGLKSVLST